MTDFSIRVELHDATQAHYTALHQRLAAVGVVDVIVSGQGDKYKLPPAEYVVSSSWSVEAVLDAVHEIAANVRSNPAVFVTTSNGRMWKGLARA